MPGDDKLARGLHRRMAGVVDGAGKVVAHDNLAAGLAAGGREASLSVRNKSKHTD